MDGVGYAVDEHPGMLAEVLLQAGALVEVVETTLALASRPGR